MGPAPGVLKLNLSPPVLASDVVVILIGDGPDVKMVGMFSELGLSGCCGIKFGRGGLPTELSEQLFGDNFSLLMLFKFFCVWAMASSRRVFKGGGGAGVEVVGDWVWFWVKK